MTLFELTFPEALKTYIVETIDYRVDKRVI